MLKSQELQAAGHICQSFETHIYTLTKILLILPWYDHSKAEKKKFPQKIISIALPLHHVRNKTHIVIPWYTCKSMIIRNWWAIKWQRS